MFGLIELKSVSQKVIMNIEMLFAHFFPSEKGNAENASATKCDRKQVCQNALDISNISKNSAKYFIFITHVKLYM